jgi:hypothetical protein
LSSSICSQRVYFDLPTTSSILSDAGTTSLVVPTEAREIALLFKDGVDATLRFATSETPDGDIPAHIYVEAAPSGHVEDQAEDVSEEDESEAGPAVQVIDAGSGVAGLILVRQRDSSKPF